jgi:anti-sigma factor RsiW
MSDELTCKELVELVTSYLENALSAEERARVEAHLATCDGCDRYVEQMRQTIESLGALRETDLTPEAQAKLLTAFRNWRGS